MNSFQFILALVFCMSIISFGLTALSKINSKVVLAKDVLSAKIEAEKCALLIDSFYANAGGSFENFSVKCHTMDNKIASNKNNLTKNSGTISQKNTTTNTASRTIIEVEVNEHYEK